jgi:tyrosyl-tRNA synthetase
MSILSNVSYPVNLLHFKGFVITRAPENGGIVSFDKFETLEASYAKQEIHPGDLKAAVELELNKLLDPIRKTFESPELKKLVEKAYPQPSKASKIGNIVIIIRKCS